jgi:hypothetical protein
MSTIATSILLLSALPVGVFGTQILSTDGFSNCGGNTDIQVQKMDVQYDNAAKKVTFDVAGTSNKQQDVTAALIVEAYGVKGRLSRTTVSSSGANNSYSV